MHRSVAVLIAAVVLAALPATASADEAVAELGRPAPVAAYGGWSAWSSTDASGRHVLALRAPDGTIRPAPYPSSSLPWDVSLGPDATGRPVAILRRCTVRGCDLQLLDLQRGSAEALPSVSSPSYRESTPAIWRSTVAFTRRVRGCDVPYVKDLRSSAPSRRLLRTKCLQTAPGHVSIRGTRIVISSVDMSETDEHGAGRKVSELRRYSARGGPSTVLLAQGFGEEPNIFGQVAQDERNVWTVRYGMGRGSFIRVRAAGGSREEVTSFGPLTGDFAKAPDGNPLYVEAQDFESCGEFSAVPCRLIAASADPFGSTVRPLAPRLTVAYTGTPRAGQPLAFSGRLTQRLVAGSELLRADPVAGVTVDLRARVGQGPEQFVATGLTSTTAADGSWAITLPSLPGQPWYTAVAATPSVPTWAGRGTVGGTMP
jgi:hypothetical protein